MNRIPPSTEPPCPQRCWEHTPRNGWRYLAGVNTCGHHYDAEARIWRWAGGHPAAPTTAAELVAA